MTKNEYKCPICRGPLDVSNDGDEVMVTCPGKLCLFHTYAQVRYCGINGTDEGRSYDLQRILKLIRIGCIHE